MGKPRDESFVLQRFAKNEEKIRRKGREKRRKRKKILHILSAMC